MDTSTLLDRYITSRDPHDFETIVRRYGPLVHRVALKITGCSHDADDVFQATFVVLHSRPEQIRNRKLLSAWLYGVATKIARRLKQRRTRLVSTTEPYFDQPNRSETFGNDDTRLLLEELERLPRNLRDPLQLCYLEGRSYVEVAELVDCPLGTLKSRLTKGRRLLRDRLARRGVNFSPTLLLALERVATPVELQPLVDATVDLATTYGGRLSDLPRQLASLVKSGTPTSPIRLHSILLLIVISATITANHGGCSLSQDHCAKSDPVPPQTLLAGTPDSTMMRE